MNRDDDSAGIEVVDAAVDYTQLAVGASTGIALMLTLVVAGRNHGLWLLVVLGAVFLIYALWIIVRILIVTRGSRRVAARIERVWIERFRQPGYAGVHPRFRVMVEATAADDAAPGRVAVCPFAADNHFDDLRAAVALAQEARACSALHIDPLSRAFLIPHVGSQRWVTSLAWGIAGSVFWWVGHLLES